MMSVNLNNLFSVNNYNNRSEDNIDLFKDKNKNFENILENASKSTEKGKKISKDVTFEKKKQVNQVEDKKNLEEKEIPDDLIKEVAEEIGIEEEVIINILEGNVDFESLEELENILSKIVNSEVLSKEEKILFLDKINLPDMKLEEIDIEKGEELLDKAFEKITEIDKSNFQDESNQPTKSEEKISSDESNKQSVENTKKDFEMNDSKETREITKNEENTSNNAKDQGNNENGKDDLASKIKVVNLKTNNAKSSDDLFNYNDIQESVNAVDDSKGITTNAIDTNLSNINKGNLQKQIIDNVKFILKDGKSEMTMLLKPENLGKLSFEMVSERGLMVAKFAVESQQVKEIIEASLPALKDALESKGLNIEGFSVSVNDNNQKQDSFNQFNRNKKGLQKHGNKASGLSASINYSEKINIVNPYLISESSVDFSA